MDPDCLSPPKQDCNRSVHEIVCHENSEENALSNESDQTQSAVLSTPSSEAPNAGSYDMNNAEAKEHKIEDKVFTLENDRCRVTNMREELALKSNAIYKEISVQPIETELHENCNELKSDQSNSTVLSIMQEELASESNSTYEELSVLPVETKLAENCEEGAVQYFEKCSASISDSNPVLRPSGIKPTVRGQAPNGEFWSGQIEAENEKETKCEAQIGKSVFQDSLSSLAKSYEDTEPVFLSGIVDHITKNDENRFSSEACNADAANLSDQVDEKFSVTDLMSNESISDIFDKVYVMDSRERTFQTSSVHRDELESELTSSSNGSGCCDTDFTSESNGTKTRGNLKRINDNKIDDGEIVCKKKSRKGITFDSVSVYYFPRIQGFTCVPSQGGSTLGMSWNHSHSRKFSLGEHAAEQRRAHKQYCLQNFNAVKHWNETSTLSSEDSDSDEVISDSEMEFENYNFLQPIPTRERRAMLRAAGVHKIDSGEKDECRSIRLSREFCGCTCQVHCDPDRCVCAQAGIKCQVDRMNFPCSCTRDGCANENGRIEFNPVRVRTHYIHTLMRLEMEKKKEDEDEQHSRLLINSVENTAQLGYSASTSSSPLSMNSNLMNFSYHTNLQMWGSEYTSSPSNSTGRINFDGYSMNTGQYSLSSSVADQYHQSIPRLGIPGTSTPPSMQYCSRLLPEESDECSRMVPYGNPNSAIVDLDQDFVIRDLTNGSKNSENEVTYNTNSLVHVSDQNFGPQSDGASHNEILDTSAEVSEETEKEESDSENFGIIIKKTMVESVTA